MPLIKYIFLISQVFFYFFYLQGLFWHYKKFEKSIFWMYCIGKVWYVIVLIKKWKLENLILISQNYIFSIIGARDCKKTVLFYTLYTIKLLKIITRYWTLNLSHFVNFSSVLNNSGSGDKDTRNYWKSFWIFCFGYVVPLESRTPYYFNFSKLSF